MVITSIPQEKNIQSFHKYFRLIHFPAILIFIGIFLRLSFYFDNPALDETEAWVGLDIMNRTLRDIVFASGYNKPVPIGFALIVKCVTLIFGNYEYALRLFPFVSGIASLFVFNAVLKRVSSFYGRCVGLGLMAVLDPLIFFTSKLKYYSSDSLCTLVLFLSALWLKDKLLSVRRMAIFCCIGALCVWISHPAVIILAGLSLFLGVLYIYQGKMKEGMKYCSMQSIWMVSFLLNYLWFLIRVDRFEGWEQMWEKGFFPTPLLSLSSIQWIGKTFVGVFKYPVEITVPIIGCLLFMIGLGWALRKKWDVAIMFLLPVVFSLAAAAIRAYPFSGRVIIFLVPVFLFFLAEGFDCVHKKNRVTRYVGFIMLIIVCFLPVKKAVGNLAHRRIDEEIRPLMRYLQENKKEGDTLYLNDSGQYAYWYYYHLYHFDKPVTILGIFANGPTHDEDRVPFVYVFLKGYKIDNRVYQYAGLKPGTIAPSQEALLSLPGNNRTWILFSHYNKHMEEIVLSYFGSIGTCIKHIDEDGAALYLFDLSYEINI